MADSEARQHIRDLVAGGLKTEAFPRADTAEDVRAVVARLQTAGADLPRRLAIAGVTLEPVIHGDIEQLCETCMYYLVHRKWCELPELDIPVEPDWSCRLWRI